METLVALNPVKEQIRRAFANVIYPGDNNLRRSNEGDEPFLLEDEFRGKTAWESLEAPFLDQAPDGFATALSFFSDAAFRFYLAAYLIADLDNKLLYTQPVFYLYHGLDSNGSALVNPRRFGNLSWRQVSEERFAGFTGEEARAIVAYLRFKVQSGLLSPIENASIEQALETYWLSRSRE